MRHPPGTASAMSERVGFFTDTSVCIGCKACEVACKEWNLLSADGLEWTGESYDNTSALGSDTWRHVAFIEQQKPLKMDDDTPEPLRWLMESDVCKHCTHAACLDVCPSAPSSERSWCRRTSATAAAIACRRARSASSTAAHATVASSSAHSATTG
jgi:Fe-S-cluster-containing dehydrogenase component